MPTARQSPKSGLVPLHDPSHRPVQRVIDSQWVELRSADNEPYFANLITGESRWEAAGDDDIARSQQLSGGIGVSVGQLHAGMPLIVEAVVKGSVAFRSQRVHVGDELLCINGIALAGGSPSQARQHIIEAGSGAVSLTLRKATAGPGWGAGDVLDVRLARRISLADLTNHPAQLPAGRALPTMPALAAECERRATSASDLQQGGAAAPARLEARVAELEAEAAALREEARARRAENARDSVGIQEDLGRLEAALADSGALRDDLEARLGAERAARAAAERRAADAAEQARAAEVPPPLPSLPY